MAYASGMGIIHTEKGYALSRLPMFKVPAFLEGFYCLFLGESSSLGTVKKKKKQQPTKNNNNSKTTKQKMRKQQYGLRKEFRSS